MGKASGKAITGQPKLNLSPQQQKFVDEYLICGDQTEAARRAGYSDPNYGRQLLAKTNVRAYYDMRMDERARRAEITQDRLLLELAAIAFADVTDFVSIEEHEYTTESGATLVHKVVNLKPTKDIHPIKRRAISSIKQGTSGIEIKFHDKVAALSKIADMQGWVPRGNPNGGGSGATLSLEEINNGLLNIAELINHPVPNRNIADLVPADDEEGSEDE